MNKLTNNVAISSVELVQIINDLREEGEATLRHTHFMDKVKKVLGEGEPNFRSSYISEQNKELPCYMLPKREASLMVMSYSYKIQAKVYDRMEELEEAVAKLPTETLVSIGLTPRDQIMSTAWQLERDLYIEEVKAKHAIALDDINQRRTALEQRSYVLVDNMQVAVMGASKVALPTETITNIMLGTGIKPGDANKALFSLGLLDCNPNKGSKYIVSKKGSNYGRNIKSSSTTNTVYAGWFTGLKDELIQLITTELTRI